MKACRQVVFMVLILNTRNTIMLHGRFVASEILELILHQYQEEKKSLLLMMTKQRIQRQVAELLKLTLTMELL